MPPGTLVAYTVHTYSYRHWWLAARWLEASVASRPVFTVGGTEPPTFSHYFGAALVPPTVANFLSGTVAAHVFQQGNIKAPAILHPCTCINSIFSALS